MVIACICPLWWLSGAAWPLEESAGRGAADISLVPNTVPAFPPLRPLGTAIERGPVSREDAGQQCRVAGPLVVVGGGGGGVLLFVLPFCLVAISVHIHLGLGLGCGRCGGYMDTAETFLGLPHSASG